jgi:hypothetical protein
MLTAKMACHLGRKPVPCQSDLSSRQCQDGMPSWHEEIACHPGREKVSLPKSIIIQKNGHSYNFLLDKIT